ncbi:hemolysin family protein [Magnetococcales bacterium HHB-1]
MDTPVIILLMLACLFMEAFFSGSEIGVVNADRLKLRHMAAQGSRGAKIAMQMLRNPEWLLSTTLVGTNIAIVTNTSLGTMLAVNLFGADKSWIAILIVAPLIWVFGEIVPKSIFQQNADTITPRVIFLLKGFSYLFSPILIIFTLLAKLLTKMLGGNSKENLFTLREELQLVLKMPSEKSDIHPMEKQMIQRLFTYGGARVRDVMIPLVEIDSIERSATCAEAIKLASRHAHRRLPVYEQRVDHIIGQVNVIDLLGERKDAPITDFIQPIRYVPGSKSLDKMMISFREHKEEMAVVVGEFGGSTGIITLEDTLERIVGDIRREPETDKMPQEYWIKEVEPNHFLINARIDLMSLRERIDLHLPDGIYETLGGFLLEKMEEVPVEKQKFNWNDLTFIIEKASKNRIHQVSLLYP